MSNPIFFESSATDLILPTRLDIFASVSSLGWQKDEKNSLFNSQKTPLETGTVHMTSSSLRCVFLGNRNAVFLIFCPYNCANLISCIDSFWHIFSSHRSFKKQQFTQKKVPWIVKKKRAEGPLKNPQKGLISVCFFDNLNYESLFL